MKWSAAIWLDASGGEVADDEVPAGFVKSRNSKVSRGHRRDGQLLDSA